MLLFSLGFATVFPWIARRSMARGDAIGTATSSGGKVSFSVDGDAATGTATGRGGKVSYSFDDDGDEDED